MPPSADIAPASSASASHADYLVCVDCGGALAAPDGALVCTVCGTRFPVLDGIPCFAQPNSFYDEYAQVHCPFGRTPKGMKKMLLRALPFWSYREWRFWRRAVPQCDRLLDIGCGRGNELFLEKAREVVGLESSLASARGCSEHYHTAVLSSAPRLPFASATFDAVVSAHVLGHIVAEEKEVLVGEIARVLRPGGITAHIVETDSVHPVIRATKRDPELYRERLVEQDGHVGLEPAAAAIARFERHGMRLLTCRVVDAIVPSVLYYGKYLDHPGFRDIEGLGWTRALARLNGAGRLGNLAYEVGFGAFHNLVEQRFGDRARANFVHLAFERRA